MQGLLGLCLSQHRLHYAVITNIPEISVAHTTKAYLLLTARVHRKLTEILFHISIQEQELKEQLLTGYTYSVAEGKDSW